MTVLASTSALKQLVAAAPRVPGAKQGAINTELTYLLQCINAPALDKAAAGGDQRKLAPKAGKGAARERASFSLGGATTISALKTASSRWCRRTALEPRRLAPLTRRTVRTLRLWNVYRCVLSVTVARWRRACARSEDGELTSALIEANGDQVKIIDAINLRLRAVLELIIPGDDDKLVAYILDKLPACLVAKEEGSETFSFLIGEDILMREAWTSDDEAKVCRPP
jgi:hypothetical protein